MQVTLSPNQIISDCRLLLNSFKNDPALDAKQINHVLASLYAVCSETRKYLQNIQRTGELEPDFESELAQLWTKTGDCVHYFDPGLAAKFSGTSSHWFTPHNWTAVEMAKFRIGLTDILKDVNRLLAK